MVNPHDRILREASEKVSYDASNVAENQKMLTQINQKDMRLKADFIPEVYFIGQIVGGNEFPTDQDGIFVEASLDFGDGWELLSKGNKTL